MTPVTIPTLAGLETILYRKADRVCFGLAGTKLKPIFEGKFIYYKHEISPKDIVTDIQVILSKMFFSPLII